MGVRSVKPGFWWLGVEEFHYRHVHAQVVVATKSEKTRGKLEGYRRKKCMGKTNIIIVMMHRPKMVGFENCLAINHTEQTWFIGFIRIWWSISLQECGRRIGSAVTGHGHEFIFNTAKLKLRQNWPNLECEYELEDIDQLPISNMVQLWCILLVLFGPLPQETPFSLHGRLGLGSQLSLYWRGYCAL